MPDRLGASPRKASANAVKARQRERYLTGWGEQVIYVVAWSSHATLDIFADHQRGSSLTCRLFPGRALFEVQLRPGANPPKVAQLSGPFRRVNKTAWRVDLPPKLDAIADFDAGPSRSTLVVLENGRPLGPPHAGWNAINGSYWNLRGEGLIFSASDNSDPNTNGRTYSVTWQ